MEQEAEDDVVDWGVDIDGGWDEGQSPKDRAKEIYKELMDDDELMHELNILLRKRKLDKIKKNEI